jgi:RNA polymerase sigma factor (sigma-70 family)
MVDKPFKRMRMPSELEQPPLSADLDWLLSSSQTGAALIVEALVREYYPLLFRLAVVILDERKLAEAAFRDTVRSVINKRHRYRSQMGATTWLFQLLIEACRHYLSSIPVRQSSAVLPSTEHIINLQIRKEKDLWSMLDEFGHQTRLLISLHYLFDCSIEEIAQILRMKEASVTAQLENARRWLRLSRPEGVLDNEAAEEWARASLDLRWPLRELDEAARQMLTSSLLEDLDQGELRHRRAVILQQMLSATVILAFIAVAGWISSRIFGVKPRLAMSPSITPETSSSILMPTEIFVTATPAQPPLNPVSSAEDVRQRMYISRSQWNRVWVDALLIRYGPPGYEGPAQVYRNQMWINNPSQTNPTERFLVISGPVFEDPIYALYVEGNDAYTIDLRSSMQYAFDRGDANPFYDLASPVHMGMYAYDQRGILDGAYLSDMLFAAGFVSVIGNLEVTGQNRYLDRDIIVLENVLQNGFSERLMVDTQTGMILSWMGYLTRNPDSVLAEIIVLNLEFDAEFPENVFSSTFLSGRPITWVDRGQYIQMEPFSVDKLPSARQRITRHVPPPPGFAPSNSCLTFQWPLAVSADDLGEYTVEVFADGYFLGETILGNPWQTLCERSANGGLVACLDPPFGLRGWLFAQSNLSWFSLAEPEERHTVLPEAVYLSSDFAFSPDGRYLGYWACLERGKRCSLYIQDTQSGENIPLLPLDDGATFFVWSLDGRYLAFVAAGPNLSRPSRLLIFDVENKEMVGEWPFRWPELSMPADSLIRLQGVKFPPFLGQFETCTQDR